MAPFHADERGNAACLEYALHVGCGARKLECLRILLNHPMDDVDLLECGADRDWSLHVSGNVYGPELTADPSGTQPLYVSVELGLRHPDVELIEVTLGVCLPESPRVVVVAVYERRLLV
jgi:hypothetical protein